MAGHSMRLVPGAVAVLTLLLPPTAFAQEARSGAAAAVSPEGSAVSAVGGPLEPVSAEARPSRTEVPLGDELEVELVVRGPAGTTYTFPAEALGEGAELRSLARAASPGGWPPDTHRYAGLVTALGDVELPPLVVGYRLPDGTSGEVTAPAIKVRGLSGLPKAEGEAKLADVRPPVSLGIGRAFYVAVGILLALLALVAYLVWRRIRRPESEGAQLPDPGLDPDIEALSALDRLARQELAEQGDLRGHYIGLTAIAKRYLERRLDAPVLEMTTAETLAFLREAPLGAEAHGVMRDVTMAADAVKFARGTAAIEEASRHLEGVQRMVKDVEAKVAVARERARAAEAGKVASGAAEPGSKVGIRP